MKTKKRTFEQVRTDSFRVIALNGLRAFLSTYIKFYDRMLIRTSKKPYKSVVLDTGLIVDHYRNGKMIANKRVKK